MNKETVRRVGKVFSAICRLPDNPTKHIYWVVYNHDMIQYTEDMIASVKGPDYLEKHVTVVAKSDPSKERSQGLLYFDPGLMDLLGNGNA